MLQKIKTIIKHADLFYSSQMLRYDDQQEYRTMTGGFFSILIIITTTIGFASMIIDTLQLSTINTTINVIKSNDPSPSSFITSPQHNFMFAVEILANITGPQRFFDIVLAQQVKIGDNTTRFPIAFQPCTKDHWSAVPFVTNEFDPLTVSNWFCPPIGHQFNIKGKYSSYEYSIYVMTVSPCKNQTDPNWTCAPQEAIDQLFAENGQRLYFTFYYSNPIINPSLQKYKQYYFQDENYQIFGPTFGAEGFILFTDYTVNTDQSIWPFQKIVQDDGVFIRDNAIMHPYIRTQKSDYINFYISRSSNTISYTRQVQKISSVFSFIGGMISAFSTILFFIKIYNSFSFQISISLSIFKLEEDKQLSPKDLRLNFFTFIRYILYYCCSKIGIQLDWPGIKYISECQTEITKQLDIKSIVKRFIFIENCLTHLFQDFENQGLDMRNPNTLSQVAQVRKKCQILINQQQSIRQQSEKYTKMLYQQQIQQSLEGQIQLDSNIKLCVFDQNKRRSKRFSKIKIIEMQSSSEKQSKKATFLQPPNRLSKRIIQSHKKRISKEKQVLAIANLKKQSSKERKEEGKQGRDKRQESQSSI